MINWEETKKQLNRSDLSGNRPQVVVQCDKCGAQATIAIRKKSKVINNQMPWECNTCIANRPEKREKAKAGALKGWQDPEYREKISQNSKQIWEDEERREKMSAFRDSPDFKEKMAQINKDKVTPGFCTKMAILGAIRWQDPEYRTKISNILAQASKEAWNDPEYVKKIKESARTTSRKMWEKPEFKEKMAIIRASMPSVSSLQATLYSVLDDLGVKYFREYEDHTDIECTIGPYNWDCVIPRDGRTSLLIECQGEYWHSLDKTIANDRRKAAYINNNLSDKYEIKYIWEHEFRCPNKVADLIKYWTGIAKTELIEFCFEDIVIKECPPKDYRLLLSKYHYLANAGRGGIAYGAYIGDNLIAVCVFSPLARNNIKIGNYDIGEVRELSRLCIHPQYQMYNLASWFVSRCLKALDPKYKLIISYCDTTFNHDGAVYKACNFKEDGKVPADYWYASGDGWVMHKQTLYHQAVRMKMKEADYAASQNYNKVFGKEKLRFIYERGI